MSFIEKYDKKQPTTEDLIKMDSEIAFAAKSGALGRLADQVKILDEYIDKAKEVFANSKQMMALINNISNNIDTVRNRVDLLSIPKDRINDLADVIKGVWINYRADHSNLPADFDDYFNKLDDDKKMDLINDVYVKAIKGKIMVNALDKKYQDILKEAA